MSDDNTKKPIKLTTEAYKGVRDFYPEEQFVQNYITGKMRKVAESFGYSEYGASVLEPAELYRAKSGEEIVNEQTYTFLDRGDRAVTLRPEMTPTVARMVAAKRRELSFPLRWYSIPNLFRYEKPQRGRVREHWQLNVDIFGSDKIEADIEIITVAYELMKSFGAKDSDFIIRVNSRTLLKEQLSKKLRDESFYEKALKLLDKKDKIDKKDFENSWSEISDEKFDVFKPNKEIDDLTIKLNILGIKNIMYDPTLVRGFDYYTGTVFEIYDTNPKNSRSLFGGGRYNNLTELFGGDKIPAVGFGMGDVTIKDFLETRNLMPEYKSNTELYICVMSESLYEYAEKVAQNLRSQGLNVSIDLSNRKIGDQIKTADKQKIPYIICIGEDEMKSAKFKVKNLKTGEEKEVALEKISECVK